MRNQEFFNSLNSMFGPETEILLMYCDISQSIFVISYICNVTFIQENISYIKSSMFFLVSAKDNK